MSDFSQDKTLKEAMNKCKCGLGKSIIYKQRYEFRILPSNKAKIINSDNVVLSLANAAWCARLKSWSIK